MAKHEKLNQYKELYSKYVELSVNLHNYHLTFIRNPSFEGGLRERKQLRNMILVTREMLRLSRAVFEEHKANLKEAKLLAKNKSKKSKEKTNG